MSTSSDFEKVYVATRDKENRLYTDEQVARLPHVNEDHIHYKEWKIRRRSAERLKKYLQQKNKPLSILEVGCGNGWLTSNLSSIKNVYATGTDINNTELDQAIRIFGTYSNCNFIYGDIRELNFHNKIFDVIVFAASVQYFKSFQEIITKAISLLGQNGEIHILDSRFYNEIEIEDARKRSLNYYNTLGVQHMSEFYFHHSFNALKGFNYDLMFDPSSVTNKIFKKGPFHWIRITA